jgi:vacuolar-type H+-ATPase subunit E/Vma4
MSENGLIERILSDADSLAQSILAKAEADSQELLIAEKNRALDIKQQNDVALRQEAEKIMARKATVAEIDAKKAVLAAKVQCVDKAFERAKEKLCALDKKAYTEFILKLIRLYAEESDIVVLSKNNNADIKALKESADFIGKKLSVADYFGDFEGGIILKGKNYDKNLTYETLLAQQKDKLQKEVLNRLLQI